MVLACTVGVVGHFPIKPRDGVDTVHVMQGTSYPLCFVHTNNLNVLPLLWFEDDFVNLTRV